MERKFSERTKILVGDKGDRCLENASVLVFGVGGVGSYVVEGLARAGIGRIGIVDFDVVTESNINRQLIALNSTIGKPKVDIAKARILDINPKCDAVSYALKLSEETINQIDFTKYDYIVDAIDDTKAKLLLIQTAKNLGKYVLCSMGTGNRIYADFTISDISKTYGDPLARSMRKKLKDAGIKGVDVLWSATPSVVEDENRDGNTIGSISYVPSQAGLMIAGHIVRKIIGVVR